MYDEVYTYDQVANMPTAGSGNKVAVFDIAGSHSVSRNLRERLQADIISWQSVGVTFVDEAWELAAKKGSGTSGGATIDADGNMKEDRKQTKGLYGGAPSEPFTVWKTLKLIVGGEKSRFSGQNEMQTQIATAKEAYIQWKLPSFQTRRHYGAEATLQVWNKACTGELDPKVTDVCSLWPSPELTEPKLHSQSRL